MEMSAQIMMMGGASAAGGDYYIADHGVASKLVVVRSVDFNAADNIVAGGTGIAAIGTADGWVSLSDNTGAVIWSKAVGAGTFSSGVYAVAFDSSGDVIVGAISTEPGYGSNDIVILKLSGADGSITWQREFGTAGSDVPYGIALDSSDNIYVVMTLNTNSISYVAKWNSSGTLQWQRSMKEAGNTRGYAIAADSSGNVYVAGEGDTSGKGFIAKYNTSGTIQWQYVLNNSEQATGIEVDASGNIYVLSEISGGSSFNEITKLSSTPAITWTRKITSGMAANKIGGIALDSSNNIYATFLALNGSSSGAQLAKYNNSGTIQWQACYHYTTTIKQILPYTIKADNSDTIVAGFQDTNGGIGTRDGVVFRAPNDGTGTGVYGDCTYSTTSLTEGAGSVTLTASSLTEAAGTATEAAGNLAVASSGITVNVTPLV